MQKALSKQKCAIIGIRKLECTYNPVTDDFHPHLHFIVSGYQNAVKMREMWLKRNVTAGIKAQDIRKANEDSIMELFKYFSKIVTKEHIYIKALDTIMRAMYGLRTFQPMGVKKAKIVTEDIEELQSQIYSDLEQRETHWSWIESDWIDRSTGETLTGYEPSANIVTLLQNIVTDK